MELTQLQISEIISDYTSSSEGFFVTLQSLMMNSLMLHERELFVKGNGVCAIFPGAAHHFCVARLKRQMLNSLSYKDKPSMAQELGEVFVLEDKRMKSLDGDEDFCNFVGKRKRSSRP